MTGNSYIYKRLALIVAVMLLAMSLALPAYAYDDWPQFQKDAQNTGIYLETDPALPTGPNITGSSVYTEGGGWVGIDSCPIYVTTGSGGHVYVFPKTKLYEYGTSGSALVQTATPLDVGSNGFQLATPASDGTSIFLAANGMYNQIQNSDFTEGDYGFDNWTLSESPDIHTDTVSTKTCAVIEEDAPSTDGDGWVQQGVVITDNTTVRVAFYYLQHSAGSAPSQHDFLVKVKKSSDADIPANWQTAITTSSAVYYDQWLPVNQNISSNLFPTTGVSYDFRFMFDYYTGTTPGSTVYGCFTGCEVITQSFGVQKVTGLGTGTLTTDSAFSGGLGTVKGQANTPLKYYHNTTGSYLLLGSWTGGTGASYICLDASTGDKKWQYTSGAAAGYYWAGACCVDDKVIFGGEDGKVHVLMLEPDANGDPVEIDQVDGGGIDPYDLPGSTTYIRTSISHYRDGNTDYLYLASRDGMIYQLTYDSDDGTITDCDYITRYGYCTSTPARYGDWVYFGAIISYNDPASSLWAVRTNGGQFRNSNTYVDIGLAANPKIKNVQASPVVYHPSVSDYVYVYATENQNNGRAFCIKFDPSTTTPPALAWSSQSTNYKLQGFAAADGKLFYGNDDGNLYYIKQP